MMLSGTTTLDLAGLSPDTATAKAVSGRADIFAKTQAAEDAVLRPVDAGRWPHDLRAAMAARIANLNEMPELAARYLPAAADHRDLANPGIDGADAGLAGVLQFMDRVAADTKNVSAEDVCALQAAGIADADIVRLAELNAFMAYQIRLIRGLQLIAGVS